MREITLVTASANKYKVAEIQEILDELSARGSLRVVLIPRPAIDDVDEYEDTLIGNAKLKALAVMRATGQPALADDTGLFVDALGGAPGVRSARYAGGPGVDDARNRSKLLDELAGFADPAMRSAEFRSVTVVVWPKDDVLDQDCDAVTWTIAEGTLRGEIALTEQGSNGFGYDQVFIPESAINPEGRTYAQMSEQEKNAISHRRRAVEELFKQLGQMS